MQEIYQSSIGDMVLSVVAVVYIQEIDFQAVIMNGDG